MISTTPNAVQVMHSSKTNEWYTPPYILDVVRTALGGPIDLDPASCAAANKTVQAERYFTALDDGLAQPWAAERLFCNPPFGKLGSKSMAGLFLQHAVAQHRLEIMKQGILLLKMVPDPWFDLAWRHADEMALIKRRVAFVNEHGEPRKQTPQVYHALVYFGSNPRRFTEAVISIARVLDWSYRL